MRTQNEIVQQMKKYEQEQLFLDFRSEVLLEFLDYDHARPFLKDGVTAEEWEKARAGASVMAAMTDYMSFAWGKANDERGLSANRSVQKMQAYLWLLGDEELATEIARPGNYGWYGKTALAMVCEKYNLPNEDNGDRG